MKTTYAKAAGSCIALSVLILAAFVLTGCQSAAEWRATQEGWATRDGLICDASLSPNPVVEHAQVGGRSEAVRVCGESRYVGRKTVGCYSLVGGEGWVPDAHIWYTAGDYYARCHEVTHAVCGNFHSASGRIDREVLKQCGGVQ